MQQYYDLLTEVLNWGELRSDRTGVGTRSVFGRQLRFNMQDGFPIVNKRHISSWVVAVELAWMIGGHTNTAYLNERGVTIWNHWADENGDLGPIYGKQWRDFGGVDQLAEVYHSLKNNPMSRRHVISAWNAPELHEMALQPCHVLMQFYVRGRQWLDLQIYIRSNDLFIGAPHNIAGYALLLHLMAEWVGYKAGELVYTIGDAHLYNNHLDATELMLARVPYRLPHLHIKTATPLSFDPTSIELIGYVAHPVIKVPVAV